MSDTHFTHSEEAKRIIEASRNQDRLKLMKPSKAAKELAGDIADLLPRGFPDRRTFEEAQRMIQSALANLLEKAETLCQKYRALYPEDTEGICHLPESLTDLAAALEPWKSEK